MKRIISFILTLLFVLPLTGCGEAKTIQESNTNSAAISETASTPTPCVFDVDDVEMQSTPGSTCFSEVGYDLNWEVLVVQFRDSGSVYTYSDFPNSEWNEFMAADSLGSWYNEYIKGQYGCEKIS